jgi:hypothetical protein
MIYNIMAGRTAHPKGCLTVLGLRVAYAPQVRSAPKTVKHPTKAAPAVLPPGGAKALVEKTCGSGRHAMEVVTSQRMSAADWNAVVQNMVARGAQASDPA